MAVCAECEYQGKGRLTWVGKLIWLVIAIIAFFSIFVWPLFVLWPFMALAMMLIPIGRMCTECGKPMRRTRGG